MKGAAFMSYDMAIIGGGAAGLSAAVFACRKDKHPSPAICVLEKGPRVGKKLLATGNGTCNISNMMADQDWYHGGNPAFVNEALTAFTPTDACRFFSSIGVECFVRGDNKVYPLCEQASAVLDCLRMELRSRGVEERCECAVTAIHPQKDGFLLDTSQGAVTAHKVLVCVGGAAAPSLGGGVDGYGLLTALGHTRTPLFPSIVQVKTDTTYVRSLKGIRVDAAVSFLHHDRVLATETGELLFTEYGISGPAVMQISRVVADWERKKQGTIWVSLDVLPTIEPTTLRQLLERRKAMGDRIQEEFLTGLLNKRLGQTILRAANLPLSRPAAELTAADLDGLTTMLKDWRIPVTGTQGMGGAQVTAGGITTAEFNSKTMESRLIPGLYAAGEVLDIDGDCGGFNLQWAWASAFSAANAAAFAAKQAMRD